MPPTNPELPPDATTLPGSSPEGLFRKQALEHFLREQEQREPLKVSPPWTWSLFWVLGALCASALLFAVLGKVEVQNRGKGILRPVAGVRMLQAQVGGVLAETFARSGDQLKAGQRIARLDAAQVQGLKLETERALALLQGAGGGYRAREQSLIEAQMASVRSKTASQEAQVASFQASVEIQERNVVSQRRLKDEQLVSALDVDKAVDALNAAKRQRDAARQQLTQLQQELAALAGQREQQRWAQTQEVQGAQTKREALESSLQQTLVLAPVDGFLEALVAKPGDLVQPGQPIAKLIPAGSPLLVLAFVAEKDRAYLKPGDEVALELEAYPYAEFGTLKGRILRIGSDLASPHEVREALGEDAKLEVPSFRLEIGVEEPRPRRMQAATLRPGMLLQARYTLRRQRIIAMVLEPLKRWFD
ncbi:MAG: HlyD family efflux transporter periplasmic adaptor subunit [Holophagaceae bacterium]|nr:HlyD family efflux transporter periplasmic adaptor subunit [Holophagaceae bacterium]